MSLVENFSIVPVMLTRTAPKSFTVVYRQQSVLRIIPVVYRQQSVLRIIQNAHSLKYFFLPL